MRNVFDQYSQPENKLTHALMVTLEQDKRELLKPFLKWLGVRVDRPVEQIHMVEQQLPGQILSGEESNENGMAGLPDACLYDDDQWALLIESKVQARFSLDQARRHLLTASDRNFTNVEVLAIVVDRSEVSNARNIRSVEWRELYSWFRQQRFRSVWAQHFTEYLEVFEAKSLADDYAIRGTLTMFDGFPFDEERPFNYREAKRLVRLLGDELSSRCDLHEIGIDPNADRRSKITGSQGGAIWDFLQFEGGKKAGGFNKRPHLTFALRPESAGAMLNFPHQLTGGIKSRFAEIGLERLRDILAQVERQIRPVLKPIDGAYAFFEVVQRHYPSRTSPPVIDARIHADLRTQFQNTSPVKPQPEWLAAAFDLIQNKRSNLQFTLAARFPYDSPVVRSAKVVDAFAKSWIAMKPMIDVGFDN